VFFNGLAEHWRVKDKVQRETEAALRGLFAYGRQEKDYHQFL
jgi:hypothetical protein